MNKAAKIVSAAIVGFDFRTVIVNNKAYVIMPPTIHRIAGAAGYLSDIADGDTLKELLLSLRDMSKLSHALSWFIKGDDSLFEELSKGTFDENIAALTEAFSLISIENFMKLSVLVKNVATLTANQK